MKTKTLFILVLMLVLAGSLFVGRAAASNAEVPFKATIHASPVLSVVPDCGKGMAGLLLKIPGEGYATHLGETTWYTGDMWACFDGTQGGNMVFTAANGDQLFGAFAGTWTGLPPNPVTFVGTFQITGGTGRFEGMTATGDYSGTSQGGQGMLYFDGMLTK